MKSVEFSDLPGARESNAGDDFHFLWAVRSCLQMLAPDSRLSSIVIEGVSRDDRSSVAQDDLLLGADLTEYYGGDDFTTASFVVVSQLKYSTRHPSKPWTASRLATHAAKQTAVIRRLADLAKAYLKKHMPGEVEAKLSIRLVSNQPVSEELKQALAAVKDVLRANSFTQTNQLLRVLPTESQSQIQTLHAESSLSSKEFLTFLSVLDLFHCGSASRALLNVEILGQLGMSSINPGNDLRRLHDLIRDIAGPGKDGITLRRSDVMAALGLGTDMPLFPAPPKFDRPKTLVVTGDAHRVAHFISSNRGRQVLVHGPAGIGKTTTLLQAAGHLLDVEVFLFDCFGGGDYMDLGEERHRPEECFVQLSNEAAIRLGTPMILYRPKDAINAGKVLEQRIKKASEIIGPNGLLVIILDAADNAVVAAQKTGSQCFVADLLRLNVPKNCCVVYSCRTHRRQLIDSSDALPQIELKGFDSHATAEFVKMRIPGAEGLLCEAIHELSSGVPRFQVYLLDGLLSEIDGTDDKPSLLALQKIAAGALDDLFEGIVRTAEGTLPALLDRNQSGKQLLAELVVLARPLTIDDLTVFAGVGAEHAEQFCRALVPGVTIVDRVIGFRDEDFETYLRSKVTDSERNAAVARISESLLARCGDHAYAATHVADYLGAAERWDKAIRLALDGPEPDAIPDEVTRLHVRMRRYAVALTACSRIQDYPAATRILIQAAEAQRTSETVFNLVRQFPDLATLYGDVERLGEIYLRQQEESLRDTASRAWLGATHLRVAAMYARQPELRDQAHDHLNAAYAWLRIRETLPEHERYGWDISDEDLASETEAAYHLGGPEAAIQSLIRWRPMEAVKRAVRLAVGQLRECLDYEDVDALLLAAETALAPNLRTYGTAYLVACLWAEGIPVPAATLERIAARLAIVIARGSLPQQTKQGYRDNSWCASGWVSTFVEASIRSGLDATRSEAILAALAPQRPSYAPHGGNDLSEWDAVIRSTLLLARLQGKEVTLDDLRPAGWPESKGESSGSGHVVHSQTSQGHSVDEQDERRFSEFIGRMLPIYQLWAETVFDACTVSSIKDRALSCARGGSDWSPYHADALTFPRRCEVAWEAVMNCTDLAAGGTPVALEFLKTLKDVIGRQPQIGKVSCWLKLASAAARIEICQNTALDIIEHTGVYVDAEEMPARERWAALMGCARAALPYSPELCQDFYRRGLRAADDVDDESVPYIAALCKLARSLAGTGTEEGRRQLAASLRSIAEGYRLRLSEEDRLPWDELLQAITALDARDGLATCYHWDRSGIRDIDDSLPTVLAEAVRQNALDPVVAIGMLAFSRDRWYDTVERGGPDDRFGACVAYREALIALKREGANGESRMEASLAEFVGRLLRDFGLGGRTRIAEEFLEWADANSVTGASLAKLREAVAFSRTLPSEEKSESGYATGPEWESKWKAKREVERLRLAELLAGAHKWGLSRFNENFEEAHSYDFENGARSYILAVAESLPHAERPQLLSNLIALVPEYGGESALRLAEGLAERWKAHPKVGSVTESAVLDLLLTRLHDVFHRFDDLVALTRQPSTKLTDIYLEGVGSTLLRWESRSLFLSFQNLACRLDEPARWQVADASMTHLLAKIEAEQPLPFPVASDMGDAVAGFLFAMFGHEKASIRWDALHAARFVSRIIHGAFIPKFMPLTVLTEAPAGFAPHEPGSEGFRWMSARVFALILIERVADESPETVRAYVPLIKRHLFNPDFPHGQARELARRALLRLAIAFPTDFSPEDVRAIEWANRPKSSRFPRKLSYSGEQEDISATSISARRGIKFKFDLIDIIPYWFDPASRVFNVSQSVFIKAAEKWASARWGHQNVQPSWNEGVRHGSLPKTETADVYVSYHAMHCAMGELVDTLPVCVHPYDSEDECATCPWEDWLVRYLPSDGFWLSDLRQATPWQADLWKEPQDVATWMGDASEDEFDRTACISVGEVGWTLVYSSVDYYSHEIYASSSVLSALVSPETASALMRALTAAEPRDWVFPIEEGRFSHDWLIEEPGFILLPLLTDRLHNYSIDHLDPRAVDVPAGSRRGIAADFLSIMKVEPVHSGQQYIDSEGKVTAKVEHWSDNPRTKQTYAFFTSGTRIWVRTDALLGYLQARDLDLIVSVTLDRNYSYEYRRYANRDGTRNEERHRIQLLRRDGSLETLAGCRPAGATDIGGPRTGANKRGADPLDGAPDR